MLEFRLGIVRSNEMNDLATTHHRFGMNLKAASVESGLYPSTINHGQLHEVLMSLPKCLAAVVKG